MENTNTIPVSEPHVWRISDFIIRAMKRLHSAFIAGNPFYPISAAFVLYGVSLLSLDATFLPNERENLIFTFSTLQFYELILVGTAVFLSFRKTYYDSMVLVSLENLFALVPFVFITHASVISWKATCAFVVIGALFVPIRFAFIRKSLPPSSFPPALIFVGLAVLMTNLALPLIYRIMLDDPYSDWGRVSSPLWNGVLPIVLSTLLIHPRKPFKLRPAHECNWLPDFFTLCWVSATAIHFTCIDWIDKEPFAYHKLVPALWILAWVIYFRADSYLPTATERVRKVLLAAPMIVPFLAITPTSHLMFLTLVILNLAAFVVVSRIRNHGILTCYLILVSATQLIGATPLDWVPDSGVLVDRVSMILVAASLFLGVAAFISGRPDMGVLMGAASGAALAHHATTSVIVLQLSFSLVLIQSLFWASSIPLGWKVTRSVIAALWMLHACIATFAHTRYSALIVASCAVVVIAIYAVLHLRTRNLICIAVPIVGLANLMLAPIRHGYSFLADAPPGLVLLMGGFLAFIIGTWIAIAKGRDHANQ